ncbi:uncharacterized protein [Physcomitrium patens]|uniref:Uncharacterized protein n=1 Tax=Physcomitrium patens TaxID=3218 RepID=A9T334_PHYPA|nr:uncharacterized protein LOC112279381 isoform X1 [Physcomitrium patens]XP_024369536.1 uncharacterized protein LOC112279381 isoform X1 [Physcomitrium patens]PNR58097.1 hypothetical protein PHYPA_005092 [Physcomitrium patens]|eukprot:XP_024369535.1 uncharacterized protein LOC112279381 isoform X1 [Physcomitrella patens]
MSCGGCGCCPKCGCQATCTCNRNIWSLESLDDFSYTGLKSASDECNDNSYLSSGSEYLLSENTYSRVAGENGGNCDLADATRAKEGSRDGGFRAGCGCGDE